MASLVHMFSNLIVHQAVDESVLLRKDGREDDREQRKTSKDRKDYELALV